jgi:hypothetical protein
LGLLQLLWGYLYLRAVDDNIIPHLRYCNYA